ncbi:N-acetyl-gamma-glutamyl-phosphate reductase [Flavitalea sp. BT771]|uniref:N-acetyl-gamma-glutamyl-phosphate reductase n=1 Tax=Flavitalea sp. BT771 TaxID=3063329 RepID=UPI0026E26F2B|nr:N-acetyl-gamma-glutamyl-phosphate reductase [Flavitalea sp. BT771]MDO6433842.1 N-acetyl-gamma-glutamyl-phosphate reductase [Flavitalea sp. BT771]MDV6222253.1 N-acetyl-gamma-glutamyl-phosphate reductase [Flavitalea sp. BT771]
MSTATGNNKTIKAGIIGGAGYTGGEMLRILLRHPNVDIRFVHSKSNAGKALYAVHEDLIGETDKKFDSEWSYDVDVLFLCLGHGEAKKFIEENSPVKGGVKIIDLSQDYRLGGPLLDGQTVIYGLPELNREAIRTARHVANPGCFATALQLGLLPLAKAGLLNDIYTTGITGSTGAGQGLSATSHFSWRANNIQAYKTLTHQHLKEVGQSLQQAGGGDASIHFVPWRGDFTRGIFVSSQLRVGRRPEEIIALYEQFYQGHPFTIVSRQPISLKQVVNTNKCLIQLEQQGSQLVVHSVIDNLTKGASGQAVQNMNLLFGLDETAGLQLKANAF